MTVKGIIYKAVGGYYYVKTDTGQIECRARGRFRIEGITPLVGDMVEIELTSDGKGYIKSVSPRRNSFVRPPVANLDVLAIVISAAPPVTDRFMIDTMAAVAFHKNIEPIIVINKCDLDRGDGFFSIYKKCGIQCVRTSAVTGEGTDELVCMLKGKVSAFSGNSGVGKSSLLNRIDPRLGLKTGQINEKIGRGRHTTRHVELLDLPNGATVADTPGFSSFDTMEMDLIDKNSIQFAFPEFAPYIGMCRFTGCAHDKDKGCAVRAAVENGEISVERYNSYVRMYRAAKEYKEWEHRPK
ncbi:MAG: ribosome small subunit-dependent GTPase A [Clostridiales bacterium]|nr:ribosome small subunit-dependent GTPase A [Clostridiales bacterium]